MNKVLLMLDVYSPFKDVLYNAFVQNLPKNYKVDLVFHFYNERLFETVIHDSLGRYNHYVIMNFSNEFLHDSCGKLIREDCCSSTWVILKKTTCLLSARISENRYTCVLKTIST